MKKRYDYVSEIDKWKTSLRPTKRILRKLVREAALTALREWSGNTGKRTVVERMLVDPIAKELVP